jgi:3,4-dihydroxy 2-butanone 4-phosphate synthase/GTP cyclohydrolase II
MNKGTTDSIIIRSVRDTLGKAEKKNRETPRPAVTLSFAQSLDGCISARKGAPTAISNDQSILITHQLRAMHNAILVGINTVLIDDPRLSVRYGDGDNPTPVVLDSQLRTPPGSRLLQQDGTHPVIVALQNASEERESRLVDAGARVVRISQASGGGIELTELFRWLREHDVNSLMIEGGAKVISNILAQGLCDQIVLTIAPRFFGCNGVRAAETLNCVRPTSSACLARVEFLQLGDNMVVWGSMDPDDLAAAGK